MSKHIKSVKEFLGSLSAEQHRFFVARESALQEQVQTVLRELGRAVSGASCLNGELLNATLTETMAVEGK